MTTDANGWDDLNTYSTPMLLAHLESLRANRIAKEAKNLIVEARTYALRIAAAERMLAIHNRRATEAEDQRVAEERTLAAMVRGLRNALLGWRDDVEAACLDWDHTITDRINAMLALAPSDEHWDRLVTIADEAFGLGPVEPLDATLTRIERGIHEAHRRSENELSDLRQRLAAATAAGELVTAERDALRAQREADLREAVLHGVHFAQDRARITDKGRGMAIEWVDEGRAEEEAARYARSKAGG